MNGYPEDMLAAFKDQFSQAGIHEAAIVSRLRQECRQCGSQKEFAKRHGYSLSYINDVLRNRRSVSENLAHVLGYQRIVSFRKITPAD